MLDVQTLNSTSYLALIFHMLDVETQSSTSYILNSYSMINFISYININDHFHDINAESMTNLIG